MSTTLNATNRNGNSTFRSASTDCWEMQKTNELLNENEAIIQDLSNIIESHAKYLKRNKQGNNSTAESANLVKSSSAFINEKLNEISSTEQKPKEKFKSKSYLLNMNHSSNVVSQKEFEKSSSKTFLKKSNNSIANCNTHATISGSIWTKTKNKSFNEMTPTASYVNSTKKKRSSLFNLFSFKPTSSSINTPQSDSPKQAHCSRTELDTSLTDQHDIESDILALPSDWEDRYRPHSVAYTNNTLLENQPSFYLKNVKPNHLSKLSLDLDDQVSEQQMSSSPATNHKPSELSKKPSFSSRGFSIPLNASFCLNPVPINCLQHFSLNHKSALNDSIAKFTESENTCMYKTAKSIRPAAAAAAVEPSNFMSKKNEHLKTSLDLDEDDEFLFKPASDFNLEEGSCLKELDQRLKSTQENQTTLIEEKRNKLKKLLKQQNIDSEVLNNLHEYVKMNNKNRQIGADLNDTFYEPSHTNTKERDEAVSYFSSASSSVSSSANSTLSSSVAGSTSRAVSRDATTGEPMKPHLAKDNFSNMFNFFTSNMTNNSKHDISHSNSKEKKLLVNDKTANQDMRGSNTANLLENTGSDLRFLISNRSLLNEDANGTNIATTQIELPHSRNLKKLDDATNNDVTKKDQTKHLFANTTDTKLTDPLICVEYCNSFEQPTCEMVQPKKGVKLRDLLRPVLNNQNMDINKYFAYKGEEKGRTALASTSLVDLNDLCEHYSGAKLNLKRLEFINESLNEESSLNDSINSRAKLRKNSFQSTKSGVDNSSLDEVNNSIKSPSTNNWQSYFNSKMSISKEKSNSKQKRNSCIAIMNDFNSSAASSLSQAAAATEKTAPISINNASLRDSVNSFQSYLPSSPVERFPRATNKNFRKMAHISSMFNGTNKNKDQLRAILEKNLENFLVELPKLPDEMCANHYDSSMFNIEPDWNKFVGDSFAQSLHKNQAKQQMAIWELLATECSHIKTTKIIIDVFLSCLVSLKCGEQTAELFKDIDIKKLFCNITDVFNCNLNFWQTYLYPIIENLERTSSKIIDPACLVDGFSNFKKLFAPYEEFILEKNNSLEYFKKHSEENEHFSRFISWAENNPLVGRLKIADFMMIPVQRLTKYELLLKKIHQFTDDEVKRDQISFVTRCVYSLPNLINIKLKYMAQFNNISESIEKYEGIVGPTDEINDILNSFKSLDIKSPLPGCLSTSNRELIHQGPLKLKDSPKSFDVHCFLFTDLLLITQLKKSKKYKIIRPPVLTNRIMVRELSQTDKAFVVISLNDYKVPDSVCMFISNQAKKWIEFLELAKKKYQEELEKAKLTAVDSNASDSKPMLNLNQYDECNESNTDDLVNVVETAVELEKPEVVDGEEPERRDSSATIVLSDNHSCHELAKACQTLSDDTLMNDLKQADVVNMGRSSVDHETNLTNSNSFKMIKSNQSALPRQYQQQHNGRFNSRILDRRIQRRNMTDPLSTASQINPIVDEKHSVIMNSIIKRNSLNDKPKTNLPTQNQLSQQQQSANNHLITNLCGDSTSTILSTDSGVSSTSCNHISYSDESISKSPPKSMFTDGRNLLNNGKQFEQVEELCEPNKTCTLKPTNSVLSTTSSTFSSSSSSQEPNMSYSSSFNSTSSSSRFASKSNSLNKSKIINQDILNEMENESKISLDDFYAKSSKTTTNHIDSKNLLIGEDDFECEFEGDETNLLSDTDYYTPKQSFNDDPEDSSTFTTNAYNEIYPTRRLFSTIKIKNKSSIGSTNLMPITRGLNYINKNFCNINVTSASPASPAKFDFNNNETLSDDLSSQYYELLNKSEPQPQQQHQQAKLFNVQTCSQVKFQQPNFLNSSSLQQQQQPLIKKKPLVKINSTVITNDLTRVNSNDLILDPMNRPGSSQERNLIDNHQRMILVKLFNTTMDATEV